MQKITGLGNWDFMHALLSSLLNESYVFDKMRQGQNIRT